MVGIILLAVALEPFLPEAFERLPEEATELELLSGHPMKIIVDLATAAASLSPRSGSPALPTVTATSS